MNIVNHLMGPYRRNVTPIGPRIAPVELRFTPGAYVPELVEEIKNKGNVKRHDCIVCSARYEPGRVRCTKHQTQYTCFTCMCPWSMCPPSKEAAMMQLRQQAIDGLRISVRSIVHFVLFLLDLGAPFVLTEVFD